MSELRESLVLAVHPTARGFGWVLFEGPEAPVLWGMVSARKGREKRLYARFERLLRRHRPTALVMESFEGDASRRAGRIQTVCRTLRHLAAVAGLDIVIYPRAVVEACFAKGGRTTRFGIARAIAARIGYFDHRMPRYRKPWFAEDQRQSLFDAAALAMTYFRHAGG